MRVCKSSILFQIFILLLSTTPIQTVNVQAQETSSLYEYGPYTVGWIHFQDVSTISGKYLPISFYYPADETGLNSEPNTIDSPYPSILLSPGLFCNWLGYANLAKMLSSWGYYVTLVGSRPSAYDIERAEDLTMTLEWLVDQNSDSNSVLYQLIDESKVGVAGHSMGSAASIWASLEEPMYKVVIMIAPWVNGEPYKTDLTYEIVSEIKVPILLVLGSEDEVGCLDIAPVAYDELDSPKFLVYTSGDDHTSVRVDSISFKYITMFCKVYLSGEEEYASYLYGEHAQQDVDEGKIELFYDISEGAPNFTASGLNIDPNPVNKGKTVTVSVECGNTGTVSGEYPVVLTINGVVEDEKTVTIGPDETTSVSFEVTAGEAGEYSIDVNGLSGSYDVEKAQTGIPGFPLESIVISMVLAVLVLWLIQRQR